MSLYFNNDKDSCYPLWVWKEKLKHIGGEEMILQIAVPSYNSGWYFCTEHNEPGRVEDKCCGKFCKDYSPRNGKSGRCRHSGLVYEPGEGYRLSKGGRLTRINQEK